jgi:hypothetical protein
VFVGKDEANRVSMLVQSLIGAANARLEFLERGNVLAVDGRRVREDF